MNKKEKIEKTELIFEALIRQGLIKKVGKRNDQDLYQITQEGSALVAKMVQEEFFEGMNGGEDGYEYRPSPGLNIGDVMLSYTKIVMDEVHGPIGFLVSRLSTAPRDKNG